MVLLILLLFMVALVLCGIFIAAALSSADRRVLFTHKQQFSHRTYVVAVPKKITHTTKLILGLDGFGGWGRRFAYYSGLHNADKSAVVIYPDPLKPQKRGERTGWNAGFCCGSGWVNDIDDVSFLTQLMSKVASDLGLRQPTNLLQDSQMAHLWRKD